MISNINQNLYMQTSDIKRSGDVAKVEGSQNIEQLDGRALEIKKQIDEGSYKLMAPHILAKVFAESELGI
jgi:anti-sigma28 factor (negative regulator of flagellin synthesis)